MVLVLWLSWYWFCPDTYKSHIQYVWRLLSAVMEPRTRMRSEPLADRPTRRRGRVTRTELGVYIVHNNVKRDALRFLTLGPPTYQA